MTGNTQSQGAVMVTGGAGYIGSHTVKALSEAGRRVVTFDNLSLGHKAAVQWGAFVHGDIRDRAAVTQALRAFDVSAVIHFAGLIEVGRSVARPDLFWEHNVYGLNQVLAAMNDVGVRRLVFSSSAAVYGQGPDAQSNTVLLGEAHPKAPTSPYGETKLAGERMIAGYCCAFGLSGIALRYFNAAGADASGVLGEAHEPETHLIPLAIDAGLGRRPPLTIFGNDFPTPDGTGLRDYIHVTDLAAAHLAALDALLGVGEFEAINVGTGQGHSVLQVIAAAEQALGVPVPWTLGKRRAGDPASLVADASLAGARLGWRARHSSLEEIVADAVAWSAGPGYGRAAKA